MLVTNYVCATCTATANLATGVFTFNGPVGNYTVNVSTGEGSPTLQLGALELNSVNTSGAASGPLKIEWTENGIATTFETWDMMCGGTLSGGAGSNVSFTSFEDNTNTFFGTMHTIGVIGPQGPGVVGGSLAAAVPGVTSPYSLTELITLNGVGATNYSGDASLTPGVPEPASVFLVWRRDLGNRDYSSSQVDKQGVGLFSTLLSGIGQGQVSPGLSHFLD